MACSDYVETSMLFCGGLSWTDGFRNRGTRGLCSPRPRASASGPRAPGSARSLRTANSRSTPASPAASNTWGTLFASCSEGTGLDVPDPLD